MPKGKKFDAARAHFEKKEIEWRHKVDESERERKKTLLENLQLKEENRKLIAENEKLKEENRKLMELENLTPEDIAKILKQAKSMNGVDSFMSEVTKSMIKMGLLQ